MVAITQKTYYALYDFYQKTIPADDRGSSLNFDSLTGGEMTISNINYKVVTEAGNAAIKYMPGITTFSPVTLLRSFDNGAVEMVDRFTKTSNLNLSARGNFSVVMIDRVGGPQAMWNLINALPLKISGFSFNVHSENYYTDFEITLQPEYIEIVFPPAKKG